MAHGSPSQLRPSLALLGWERWRSQAALQTWNLDPFQYTVKSLILDALKPETWMILVWSCSCRCLIHWTQGLCQEWRCSWSSADRRCSNYIWVMNDYIAYKDATYIRGLTVKTIFLDEVNSIIMIRWLWGCIMIFIMGIPTLVRWSRDPKDKNWMNAGHFGEKNHNIIMELTVGQCRP